MFFIYIAIFIASYYVSVLALRTNPIQDLIYYIRDRNENKDILREEEVKRKLDSLSTKEIETYLRKKKLKKLN